MDIQHLQFKLQNILKANSLKRKKLSTYWKIEPSRLAHYKTSNYIYSEPIPNTGKKYTCEILLDVSASMLSGRRINNALLTCQNLIKLFNWIIDFKITCFWLGSFSLSNNEILSIDSNKIDNFEYFNKVFQRKLVVVNINWKKSYITKYEWEGENTDNWTLTTPALANAWLNLINREWDKFIVLITDWAENLPSIIQYDMINWISTNKYNKHTHRELVKFLRKNNINILPIWIGSTCLDKYYDEYVYSDNWADILPKVLKFMEKNFGEIVEY